MKKEQNDLDDRYAVCFIGNGRATALAPDNVYSSHPSPGQAQRALIRMLDGTGAYLRNYAVIDTESPHALSA